MVYLMMSMAVSTARFTMDMAYLMTEVSNDGHASFDCGRTWKVLSIAGLMTNTRWATCIKEFLYYYFLV